MNDPKRKWRFAIGTTSLVPCNRVTVRMGPEAYEKPERRNRKHYLICDIDQEEISKAINFIIEQLGVYELYLQQTKHGWHIYTGLKLSWSELRYTLRRIPGVDPAWIGIGEKRGYYYLADKDEIKLPWPVVRMVIYHRKTNGKS